MATVGLDWHRLTDSAQAAFAWAAAFGGADPAGSAAQSPATPLGTRSLLLGVVRAHPQTSPADQLLAASGAGVEALVGALVDNRSEGDTFDPGAGRPVPLQDFPEPDGYVQRALDWAFSEGERVRVPEKKIPLSFVFGGLLFADGSAAEEALATVVGRDRLEQVKQVYRGYLDVGDRTSLSDYLAERLPPAGRGFGLPGDLARFRGRAAEIAAATAALTATDGPPGRPRVVSIIGPEGVGKTALAVHVAHRLAGAFPDGRYFLGLEASGQGRHDLLSTFVDVPLGPRCLVVLDDAWGAEVRDYAEFSTPVPQGGARAILATSRQSLATEVDLEIALEPLPQFRRAFGGFAGDLASGADRLGFTDDVESLSTLLAARTVEPPISVGLFGDWGTGKSFFMNQMQKRIRDIAAEAAAAEAEFRAGTRPQRPDFHTHIRQITFNAWHYADANLWAGLVTRIFEGLAEPDTEEDVDERERRRLETERAEILGRLESATRLQAEVAERREAAAARRSRTEHALGTVRRKRNKARQRMAGLQAGAPAAKVDLGDLLRSASTQVAESTGLKLDGSLEALEDTSQRLRFTTTRLALAARRSWADRRQRRVMVVASAVAAGLGAAAIGLLATGRLAGVVAFMASMVTVAAGVAPILAKALERVNEGALAADQAVRDAYRRRAEKEREQVQALARQEAGLRAELARLAGEETRLRDELDRAAAEVRQAERDLEDIRAGHRLYRFIEERAASPEYQRYVGLIGLIRRDFSRLARLMRRAQTERDKGEAPSDPGLPRVDRIVLYIDDLDRCPADRVVEVLEAVHLLLAFPLFAVVVGVDSRWLLRSLQRHYAAQLTLAGGLDGETGEAGGAGEVPSGVDPDAAHWAATPQNYLEKIFQIPFTIRAMDTPGFARLVDDLFGSDGEGDGAAGATVEAAAGGQAAGEGTPAEPSGVTARAGKPAGASGSQPGVEPAGDGDGADGAGEDSTGAAARRREAAGAGGGGGGAAAAARAVDLNPEGLRIESFELGFLKRLAPMISTPRSAKRLVNTYRMLRTALDEPGLDGLLGRSPPAPAEYPVVLMLLGVLIGFPALANDFFEALLESDEATWSSFAATLPHRPPPPEGSPDGSHAADPPAPGGTVAHPVGPRPKPAPPESADAVAWRRLNGIIDGLGDALPGHLETHRRWARTAIRYSFQTVRLVTRYEGDEAGQSQQPARPAESDWVPQLSTKRSELP